MPSFKAVVAGVAFRVTGDDEELLELLQGFFLQPRVGEPAAPAYPGVTIQVSTAPPPAIEASGRIAVAHGDGWVFAYEAVDREGSAWFDPGRAVDAWQVATPLRLLVAWGLEPHHALVHAAAVAGEKSAVLVGGPSGRGKSTIAWRALRAGLSYLGDDWVSLHGSPRSYVSPVYRSLKLAPGAVDGSDPADSSLTIGLRARRGFGRVAAHAEKDVFLVNGMQPRGRRVGAVVIPEIARGDREIMRVERIGAAEAMRGLAPSTLLQSPQVSSSLGIMKRCVESVPCYRVVVGQGQRFVPGLLEQLCRG